jgi:3-isopropylmalate/(R)-2-methylmalate dehydratase small subunit
VLPEAVVEQLFRECYGKENYSVVVDLENQWVTTPAGEKFKFDVDAFRKHCLLNGLDDIGLTLEDADKIVEFENEWRKKSPWLFDVLSN